MRKAEISGLKNEKKQKVTISKGTVVTSQSLGRVFGITSRRVRQLVDDKVLERNGSNDYDLIDNVQRYYAFKNKDNTEDYSKEHTKLEKAKRELAELELAEKKKNLHKTEDIELMVGGMVVVFKRAMLSIPHKIAKQCEGKTKEEISSILTKEINEGLEEISNFDASKLGEMNDSEEDE